MPAVSEEQKKMLGPLIEPFGRSSTKSRETHIYPGEDDNTAFVAFIHDGIENSRPPQYVEITAQEVEEYGIRQYKSWQKKCFLWVIDETSIKIIWEGTLNVLRSPIDKPYVCHTNITGCEKAYIGGEMYFCDDGNIYVNFKSDRYGNPDTEEKQQAAIEYMSSVGYKNVILVSV